MFPLAASKILGVGALLLAGGAVAGGFYLYAETRDDGPGTQAQLVLTPTVSSIATATPPADEGTVEATPTPSLIRSRTPVDTSDWPTYADDPEFSIKYPPDWTLDELSPTNVDITNSIYLDAAEPREFVPPPGAAILNIKVLGPREDDRHSINTIVRECETGQDALDPPGVASEATISGRPAVICSGVQMLSDNRALKFDARWILLSSGRTLVMTALRWDVSALEDQYVEAIVSSLQVATP